MSDISKRTRFLVDKYGGNPNAFSVKTGILPPVIHRVLNGSRGPNYNFITKLLTSLPEVSPRWYLLDQGVWNADETKPLHRETRKVKEANEQLKKENIYLKIIYAEERIINEALRSKIRKSL